jgi:hypothetical protein
MTYLEIYKIELQKYMSTRARLTEEEHEKMLDELDVLWDAVPESQRKTANFDDID